MYKTWDIIVWEPARPRQWINCMCTGCILLCRRWSRFFSLYYNNILCPLCSRDCAADVREKKKEHRPPAAIVILLFRYLHCHSFRQRHHHYYRYCHLPGIPCIRYSVVSGIIAGGQAGALATKTISWEKGQRHHFVPQIIQQYILIFESSGNSRKATIYWIYYIILKYNKNNKSVILKYFFSQTIS